MSKGLSVCPLLFHRFSAMRQLPLSTDPTHLALTCSSTEVRPRPSQRWGPGHPLPSPRHRRRRHDELQCPSCDFSLLIALRFRHKLICQVQSMCMSWYVDNMVYLSQCRCNSCDYCRFRSSNLLTMCHLQFPIDMVPFAIVILLYIVLDNFPLRPERTIKEWQNILHAHMK